MAQIGSLKVSLTEVGMVQVSPPEVGTAQVGITKHGVVQVGMPEIGAAQMGASEIGMPQVSILQRRPLEVSVDEVRSVLQGSYYLQPAILRGQQFPADQSDHCRGSRQYPCSPVLHGCSVLHFRRADPFQGIIAASSAR
jgi:hypothetical protein